MTSRNQVVSVKVSSGMLEVAWEDGVRGEFAPLWLRDNLTEDRDSHNGQRLTDVADLPLAPRIVSASRTGDAICITWDDASSVSSFDGDWLRAYAGPATDRPERVPRLWLDGSRVDARREFAWQAMDAIVTDAATRLDWSTRLLQDGIAFIGDVPRTDGGILEAMAPLGRVEDTNYGLVFDVRAVPQPENLAYSDLGLGLHTDNPYREPVPGFQALHALVTAPDGGDSLFADGFALAEHLRASAPESFARLTDTPVAFHYRSSNADLYAERPLIELSCTGSVVAVNYNSRSIAPLRLPARDCAAYYVAYRQFATLLRDSRFQAAMRLGNGELVLFDNRRILHGRTGFQSALHPRHLRGCYLTRDSVYSAVALLRRQLRGAAATPG